MMKRIDISSLMKRMKNELTDFQDNICIPLRDIVSAFLNLKFRENRSPYLDFIEL